MAQSTCKLPHMRVSLKAELENRFSQLGQDANYMIATCLGLSFKASPFRGFEAERTQQKIVVRYTTITCDDSSKNESSSPISAKRIRDDETASTISSLTRKSHNTF